MAVVLDIVQVVKAVLLAPMKVEPIFRFWCSQGAGGIPGPGQPALKAGNEAGFAVQNTGAGGGGGGAKGGAGGSGIVIIAYPT